MNTKNLVILRGAPRSGKTTIANEYISRGYSRVNMDNIRMGLYQKKTGLSQKEEKYVKQFRGEVLAQCIEFGQNIVDDNVNSNVEKLADIIELAKKNDYTVEVKTMDTSLQECLSRNETCPEEDKVPEKVIRRFYHQIHGSRIRENETMTTNKPLGIIVDLDGTIAINSHRNIFDYKKCVTDTPNTPIIDLILTTQKATGAILLFTSGRENICYNETSEWLDKYIPSSVTWELLMRPARDHRKDDIVKEEIYQEYIKDAYSVIYAFDDRISVADVWKSHGIPTLIVDANLY